MKNLKKIYLMIVNNPATIIFGLIGLDIVIRLIEIMLGDISYTKVWCIIHDVTVGLNFVILGLLVTYGLYYAIKSVFKEKKN